VVRRESSRRRRRRIASVSAYKDALIIDDRSSDRRLALAKALLKNCRAVILLDGALALRAEPGRIVCEVIDPQPSQHRCAEEFAVLVENARRALQRSKLSSCLPARPQQWVVVEDTAGEPVEIWAAS
jgi:hypothetical protein